MRMHQKYIRDSDRVPHEINTFFVEKSSPEGRKHTETLGYFVALFGFSE
jgi:hypothetical protein